ncbi:DUF3551 domain-containing protein [Tardiphaga sp. 20_F10_N6_6]|jgi:hypothetical protein|uniref:DUF3551 domain-containing protein n=1 Tax=unclassified Tardiphaga TaxID=2631404 RepID=UPI003F25F85A
MASSIIPTIEKEDAMQNLKKRFLLSLLVSTIVASASMVFVTTQSEAKGRVWCAKSQSRGTDCSYDTIDQCRAAVSGTGASCRKRVR